MALVREVAKFKMQTFHINNAPTMEAVSLFETFVPTYETTRRYKRENHHINLHRRENPKSCIRTRLFV
jgi:hypothetical protein